MKNYKSTALPLCLILGLYSCGPTERQDRDTNASTTIDSSTDTTKTAQILTADVDLNADGKIFIINLSSNHLFTEQVSKVAVERSQNSEIKKIAAAILQKQKNVGVELQKIAGEKGFELPTAVPAAMASDLTEMNTLADRAFDLQYLKTMINAQQKSMQWLTDASKSTDADIKTLGLKYLPAIQEQNKMFIALGKKMNMTNANNGDDILGISPTADKK